MKHVFAFDHIGDNKYEERHGLYYDEFETGDVILHRPGRTITEADNTWMSLLCHNVHPLHIDCEYAKGTEFGQPVVSSLVSLSIITGMSTHGTSANAVANLGWDAIRLLRPVFVGDTVYAETTVAAKRPSASRPNSGIVTFDTVGKKSDGSIFIEMRRNALIPVKPSIDGASI